VIDFVDTEHSGYYDENDEWIDEDVVVIGELTW